MAEGTVVTREQAKRRNIFSSNGAIHDLVVCHHNVEHVVPAITEATMHHIRRQYAPRGLTIPIPSKRNRRTRIGLLITTSESAVQEAVTEQLHYLSAISGLPFMPITPDDIQAADSALVVPYWRSPREEVSLQALNEVNLYGLPGSMSALLKNKADSHMLLKKYDSDTFRVVDFQVVKINDIAPSGSIFLTKIQDGYQELGLLTAYATAHAIGVVLRAAEADGGYGNCIVRKEGSKWVVSTDGVEAGTISFETCQKALKYAQKYLLQVTNPMVEERVVMSRLIDKVDSPGSSIIIQDNHVISLGWNGQIQKLGKTACIGTGNYVPKDDSCKRIQKEYEEKMVEEYERFLRWFAGEKGVDFSNIRAIINVDLLIPSALEFEQQRRRGQTLHLPIAEFNPRFTEYTDALVGGTLFSNDAQTPQGLLAVRDRGVHTLLRFPLSYGTDPRDVRKELQKRYQKRKDYGLVVVRAAPAPQDGSLDPAIPVIIYGDVTRGMRELRNAANKVKQK